MKILRINDFPIHTETAVAVGLFDGVHLGHQQLITEIQNNQALASVAYTFDIKPAAKEMLFTAEEKISIFSNMGIDYYYSQIFNQNFACMSPRQFVEMLVHDFQMKHLTVGYDFRFGKDAAGDTTLLKEYASDYGYTLCVIPEVDDILGEKISSSLIRKLIKNGDMERAAHLLGKYYFIDGKIEKGNCLGNQIGFPTANITSDKLLPLYGVYATLVKTEKGIFPSVTNVGVKPTVQDEGKANVEAFILNFNENLYGSDIRVFFIQLIRGERKFDSIDALKTQIATDSSVAAGILKNIDVYKAYLV